MLGSNRQNVLVFLALILFFWEASPDIMPGQRGLPCVRATGIVVCVTVCVCVCERERERESV